MDRKFKEEKEEDFKLDDKRQWKEQLLIIHKKTPTKYGKTLNLYLLKQLHDLCSHMCSLLFYNS